jgi:hypothetical protein
MASAMEVAPRDDARGGAHAAAFGNL